MLTPTTIIFANQYETILPFKLWFVFYRFYVHIQFIVCPNNFAHRFGICTKMYNAAMHFFVLNAFLNCRPHKFPFHNVFFSLVFAILPCNVFSTFRFISKYKLEPTPIFGSGLMYGNGISFLNVEHVKIN